MKNLLSKRARIILGVVLVLLVAIILIVYNWIMNQQFRLKFNLIFNCDDTHSSYVVDNDGDVHIITIQLPPSTTFEHKHSDTAATYYSKLSYEEFLQYYIDNGYQVEEGKVYTSDGIFIMTDESETRGTDYKYYFIDIDLWMPVPIPEYSLDATTIFKVLEERAISNKVEEVEGISEESEDYKATGYALRSQEDDKLLAVVAV